MNDQAGYEEDISRIRTMMERSSRFLSLSGLAGVSAGLFALIGTAVAYNRVEQSGGFHLSFHGSGYGEVVSFLVADAMLVLVTSLFAAYYFSNRKAKKDGVKTWNATSKRLIVNLGIPLIAGGIVCIALLYHGLIGLVAPATLVFYGLALVNGGKYTLDDIRSLGLCQTALGVAAMFLPDYGLWFWAFGFGVLHIIYGIVMYYKYERNA